MKTRASVRPQEPAHKQYKKFTQIEADAEAALLSRTKGLPAWIIRPNPEKDAYIVRVANFRPEDSGEVVSCFKAGREVGGNHMVFHAHAIKVYDGEHPIQYNEDGSAKASAVSGATSKFGQVQKQIVPGNPRVKKDAVPLFDASTVYKYSSAAEAAKATGKQVATIGFGKKFEDGWFIDVRGSWALQQNCMEHAKAGLILIIKEQGYYVYPKKMFGEFESIMASGTYLSGKPYSQSKLPAKFEKYFTKFK
jgi:hypothetical protein